MSRLLLTGASGFLGSALARRLAHSGRSLHLMLRSASSLERLGDLDDSVSLHVTRNSDEVIRAVEEIRPTVVVHTACAYGRTTESPRDVFDANVALGVALLQGLTNAGQPSTFVNTGTVLEKQVSLYALTKRQFSEWGSSITETNTHIQFIDLRLQHMYGPGDSASKFTTHVIRACARNEPLLSLTAGEQRRDFIFIDDVVSAYERVLAAIPDLARSETIDIGSGEAPSVRHFVELAHRLTQSRTRLEFGAVPYRANEPMLCCADTARLRALGWRPAFDLESGIQETIRREQ